MKSENSELNNKPVAVEEAHDLAATQESQAELRRQVESNQAVLSQLKLVTAQCYTNITSPGWPAD